MAIPVRFVRKPVRKINLAGLWVEIESPEVFRINKFNPRFTTKALGVSHAHSKDGNITNENKLLK